jgi:hypothetical protein
MAVQNSGLKDFIVNVLGCGCPEEVFASIEVDRSPQPAGPAPLAFEISVGGRLLIQGVKYEEFRLQKDALADLVAIGVRKRDEKGFNRVRIVVVSDDPDCEATIRPVFEGIQRVDDRIHLHVVKRQEILPLLECGGERNMEMEKLKTEPTVWHEMEGPFIGGREHYQEKSYGFNPPQEPEGTGEEGKPEEEDH